MCWDWKCHSLFVAGQHLNLPVFLSWEKSMVAVRTWLPLKNVCCYPPHSIPVTGSASALQSPSCRWVFRSWTQAKASGWGTGIGQPSITPGQRAVFAGHVAHICIPNTCKAKGGLLWASYHPGLQSKNVSKQVNKLKPTVLQLSTQESSAFGLLVSHF